MSTETPRPRLLSEAERNEILRSVVYSKVTSQQRQYGHYDAWGTFQFQRWTGPGVLAWGDTWAEVFTGNWTTHGAVIVRDLVFTTLTCGLYLPFWFFRTFKKPPLYRISIDEYGYESWTQHDVSQGQKVVRWVLLAVMVLVALWFMWGIVTYGDSTQSHYSNYSGLAGFGG